MKTANMTPHISCSPEDFAKTVLMPGDPLRAKHIAETYLTDYELVNNVEGRKELLDGGLDPELIRIAVGAEPFEELKAVFEEALA